MTDDAARARDWADEIASKVADGGGLGGGYVRQDVAKALRAERLAAEARGRWEGRVVMLDEVMKAISFSNSSLEAVQAIEAIRIKGAAPR